MAFSYKLLLLGLLLTVVSGQSTSKQKSSTSSAGKTRYSSNNAVEQSRTLGLIRPLLRLGLRRPLRAGVQGGSGSLADPAYGGYNGYNGFGGNGLGGYGGYPNYAQYGGLQGVGFGGGYRPPVAYPQYNGYVNPYQQQNYGGLNALSALSTSANAGGAANAANAAQQSQLATVLGQALGSSLRPLLTGAGGGGGRYGTAAATAGAAGGGNALAGLLSLFG